MGEVLLLEPERAFFSDRTPTGLRYLLNSARGLEHPAAVEAPATGGPAALARGAGRTCRPVQVLHSPGRYAEAEAAVWEALRRAAACAGFSRNYRRLHPASADWQTRRGAERLYLFSLKALGVIRLRRGKVDNARRVLEKLLQLDPGNEIGGEAFLQIARAFEEEN